jgi:hypothetical protein
MSLVGRLDEDAARAATEEPAAGLRDAAGIGFDALDRGAFKEFDDANELERYLNKLADQTIRKSAK